ncbi:MFS transporter, DHA1 family, bicyclomycin/chloramphenicol resistance protein [Marinactinospora thermotolerans DSM 45154]|uniref:MFS transporter, DHA1 family, bicyclomycin/chloramphenicol resistance protein n=1 Tax=Marinactinospora thermotolerans DSM 45154 TaxID=1122192 RepID=A0A1T4P8J4_9ACTN|nr:multidrug effflux MFS transporter [Marinactinospora thermotolerans]SJZ87804.1 MFS transporter, DHA1 family, bicyclomycin/chloramphenicol resistance protein [Marinactinospora thermotolerans DSM 45154]
MTHVLTRPRLRPRHDGVVPGGPRPRRSVALLVFVLGVLAATGPLATDLYLPAFPQIAADLGAPESRIQLTLTAIMVGMALGQLVIGPLSDVWGRRVPLLVGVAVFTLTSFACALVPSAEAFIVIRFVQGLAGAAGAVISRAIVRDMFDGDAAARFFSKLALVTGLAPMLGPVLGGQLLLVGPWQMMFVALGLSGLVSFVLVLAALPESLPAGERRALDVSSMVRTFGRQLRDPRFIAPTLTLSLSFGMTFTYISAFSFVSQNELGATAQQFSLIFGVNTLGMIIGNQVNVALIGKVHTSRRLLGGLVGSLAAIVALVALGMSGHAGLLSVTAILFVMMFFTGFISPNATSMAISSQSAADGGSASALLGTLQFAIGGGLAATAGLTPTGEASLVSMSLVMLLTAVASLALFARAMVRGQARAV